jgi:oxygen-independent coproporphyrinogen-3 oxidase
MTGKKHILQLVQKYNQSGPRYTSYPTAPQWHNDYGPGDYISALEAAADETDEPLSLYVHYPFCRKLCYFCGCNKVISSSEDKADAYLDRVEDEIQQVSTLLSDRKQVTQMHWGGGTPSLMTEEQTRRSFAMLAERFDIADDAEIAMELDPRTTSHEKLKWLRELGFNRISFGVQDLNDDVQRAINRDQSKTVTTDLYNAGREKGFDRINLDLIYGLPKQTLDYFRKTLEGTLTMRPDRVAMYSYAHLPKRIPAQRLIDETELPKPSEKFDMYLLAQTMFLDSGYVQIGMDHFVLPEDELALALNRGKLRRNFMGYTVETAQDWIGFGVSAISYIHHEFAQNLSKIKEYHADVDAGHLPVQRGMQLSHDDLIRQFAIAELMCNFRLDGSILKQKFQIESEFYFEKEFVALIAFAEDGLVSIESGSVRVTEPGKNFVRNIAMIFDAYLKSEGQSPRHQYSKTI